MADIEESVRETQVTQQGDTQVVRDSTSRATSAGGQTMLVNVVWLILGILETLLVFRFVLKFLGANTATSFVNGIYNLSHPFITPFAGIFTTPTMQGDVTTSVFETATLVAILVYAVVAWGIVSLVSLNRK